MVAASITAALLTACTAQPPQTNGYKPGVHPGMSRDQVEAILGKPTSEAPFSLLNLDADVLTYQFGQVLLEHKAVVAISVTADATYVGPFGIALGVNQDAVKAAFHAHPHHRAGHLDAYDVVVGTSDTRTRDLYDQTDHLMIEMAAANPNDPMAPFNVICITQADDAGLALLVAITKAKVGGMYPDQHVFNYVSDPWST